MKSEIKLKKKLVGILIGMLMFATISSVVGDLNDNVTNTTNPTPRGEVFDWWPTFQHDNNNSGFSTSEAPDSNNVLWTYPTGSEIRRSSPAVVDGKLYIGARDNNLYCLNIEDGSLNWSSNIGGWADSPPVVDDGKVYVATYLTSLSDSYVKCLYAENGSLKWEYPIDVGTDAPLAVYGGKLYFGLTTWAPGENPDAFYCLNAENGSLIWRNIDGGSFTGPAFADGKVYVSQSRNIYCLDAETGEINWNYSANGGVQSPAIANGRVYFGSSDNNTYCFDVDPSDGVDEGIDDPDGVSYDLIWMFETGDSVYSSPAVAYGNVYVGSNDGKLYCLDAENGSEIWNYDTGYLPFRSSSPAVADGKVYIGAYLLNLYCINAENGDEIWRYDFGGYIHSSPAVVDGKLYIGAHDGNVYCFRDNEPPETPNQPEGPTSGHVDVEYTYTVDPVTDPEDEGPVEYLFDWGDESDSGWIDTPSASHNWSAGTYNVTVKARDIYQKESNFSIPLEVTIRQPELNIGEITGGLLSISIEIKNPEEVTINNVNWNITITGGIFGLINISSEGTIETLGTGSTEVVSVSPVVGLGPIEINVTASAEGVEEITKTAEGFVLFFFVIVN